MSKATKKPVTIDSEARSRKFPAKPTRSTRADALKTQCGMAEKAPLGVDRRRGLQVPGPCAQTGVLVRIQLLQ